MLLLVSAFWSLQATDLGRNSNPNTKPLQAEKRRLYVVPGAHLDTQWHWTIQDTIAEHIPVTILLNFRRFDHFPNYVFNFEGAFRYMLIKEYTPELFDRIREYVKKGQWRISGSFLDACDVIIPSPESIIRQVLYGNNYFEQEFGETTCDIFLPDCFGFSYALPSIAAHCNLKGFSTQKLTSEEAGQIKPLPFTVGRWEGPDGSQIIAVLDPGSLSASLHQDLSNDEYWQERIAENLDKFGLSCAYRYMGTGDNGGAPSWISVKWLEKSIANPCGPLQVIASGSDQFFRDLTDEQVQNLPVFKGELLLREHGVGCYTAKPEMKRWNRQNELLADAAERAAVIANWLGALDYPHRQLRDAWIRFLWHQFHDDLTGTSDPAAYCFSWNDEIIASNQLSNVLESSLGAIARSLDTDVQGTPLIVYNPLSIAREDIVETTVHFEDGCPQAVEILDGSGEKVPVQILVRSGNEMRLCFLAGVPSVGVSVFEIRPTNNHAESDNDLKVRPERIENRRYVLSLNQDGDIAQIHDKQLGLDLLTAPIQLQLLPQVRPHWYAAWEIDYETICSDPYAYFAGPAEIRVVESGPVRATVEVVRQVADSTLAQRITLFAGQAASRIEVASVLDWRTRHTLLKAAFPLAATNAHATYDLGLGTIQRSNNTEEKYEVPAQQWADLTAADGSFGIAILNDCKYGWDKPQDSVLRLTLIHSPHPERDNTSAVLKETEDYGRHKFKYALYSHSGNWGNGCVPWQAARLNQPLVAFQPRAKHSGSMRREFSLFELDSPNVMIKAIKQAEDGDDIVVRLHNLTDRPVRAKLATAVDIRKGSRINGVESFVAQAEIEGNKLSIDMNSYQLQTFALKLQEPSQRLETPKCLPVALPHNTQVSSFDGDKLLKGGFDQNHYAIPAELLPESLVFRGVYFKLGSRNGKDAVACDGQRIVFPPAKYKRLYLLMAADGDTKAVFRVNNRDVELNIQDWQGWIGQADSPYVNGRFVQDGSEITPAFTKLTPIAWLGTHLHNSDGRNEPYRFCYLYQYVLELPDNPTSMTLPNDARIKLLAATLSDNPNDDFCPSLTLCRC